MAKREAVLSLIVESWGGMHPGAWREPEAPVDASMDFERVKNMALTAERGKFHMFFLADSLGYHLEKDLDLLPLTSSASRYEPLTLLSALSVVTNHIGLAATVSTTYSEPFNVARMFASLDHLSAGRACWNVVASTDAPAPNFNDLRLDHSTRYVRASEYVDVVEALWDSWEDDAFLRDKTSGIYFDRYKLHVPDHRGEFFSVRGPLNVSRPIQGHPVIAQAGSSPEGLDFATSVADVLFIKELPDLEVAQQFYADIKERVASHGRDPDHVKVLPGLCAILGRTQAEAEERLARLDELVDPRIGLERLKVLIDFDLSGYPLDGPVPDDIPETEYSVKTNQKFYLERARRENLTIRQLAMVCLRFNTFALSTEQIADRIAERVEIDAADGYNLTFADAIGSLDLFVDEVVPQLQRRGVFRTDYQGQTLRENLGIPRPQNRFALAAASPSVG